MIKCDILYIVKIWNLNLTRKKRIKTNWRRKMGIFSKKNYNPNEDKSMKDMLKWASERLRIELKKGKKPTYNWNGYEGFSYEDEEKRITWFKGILEYQSPFQSITWKEGEGIILNWSDI